MERLGHFLLSYNLISFPFSTFNSFPLLQFLFLLYLFFPHQSFRVLVLTEKPERGKIRSTVPISKILKYEKEINKNKEIKDTNRKRTIKERNEKILIVKRREPEK